MKNYLLLFLLSISTCTLCMDFLSGDIEDIGLTLYEKDKKESEGDNWWARKIFETHGWGSDAPTEKVDPIDKKVKELLVEKKKYRMYISEGGDLVTEELEPLEEKELSDVLKEMDRRGRGKHHQSKVFIYARKKRKEELKTLNMLQSLSVGNQRRGRSWTTREKKNWFHPYGKGRNITNKMRDMKID